MEHLLFLNITQFESDLNCQSREIGTLAQINKRFQYVRFSS